MRGHMNCRASYGRPKVVARSFASRHGDCPCRTRSRSAAIRYAGAVKFGAVRHVVAGKVPAEIKEALQARAAAEGSSVSSIIRRALRREFYDVQVVTVIVTRSPGRTGRPRKVVSNPKAQLRAGPVPYDHPPSSAAAA